MIHWFRAPRSIAPRLFTLTLGYIRVSTDLQDLSNEAQAAQIQRYAQYQNLGEPEIYSESAVSGSMPFETRPEGKELLERIREHQSEFRNPKSR